MAPDLRISLLQKTIPIHGSTTGGHMIQQGLFGKAGFDTRIDDERLARFFRTTPVEIRMMKIGLRRGVLTKHDVLVYLEQRQKRPH